MNVVLPEVETKNKIEPPWVIIFFNDDKTDIAFVLFLLIEIFKKNDEDAYNIVKRIEKRGSVIVFTGNLEQCEFKYERVKDLCTFHKKKYFKFKMEKS